MCLKIVERISIVSARGTPVTNLEQRECLEQIARMFNMKLEDVASLSQAMVFRPELLRV